MQQQGLNCQRDEYPPAGFWQDQDIHDQWVRMVARAENGAAGAALFGLTFCRFYNQGRPSSETRNARFDRLVHGPDRDTEVSTGDVTTTLPTVSIRFNAFPNQPDFGLMANPCWASTLVNEPGFALLNSDPWYFGPGNGQRHQTALASYPNPPPFALTNGNPPRPGYQKRFLDPLDMDMILDEGNTTLALTEDYVAARFGIHKCRSSNCVNELKQRKVSSVYIVPPALAPRASEAEPTAADIHSVSAATSTAPMAGGGMQLALGSLPKPAGGIS